MFDHRLCVLTTHENDTSIDKEREGKKEGEEEKACKRENIRRENVRSRERYSERDRKTETKFGRGRENVCEREQGLRNRVEEGEAGLRGRIKGMRAVEVERENWGNDDEW